MFCYVNRPSVYSSPPEFVQIEKYAEVNDTLVLLVPFSKDARRRFLQELICTQAAIGKKDSRDDVELPPALVEFVSNMGAGNPKNILELVDQLKDDVFVMDNEKRITLEDGRVVLRPHMTVPGAFSHIEIPVKMQGAIDQLIDKLTPLPTQIIKHACMLDVFTDAMLKEMLPPKTFHTGEIEPTLVELDKSGVLEEQDHVEESVSSYHPHVKNLRSFKFTSKLLQRRALSKLLEKERLEMKATMAAMNKRRDKQQVLTSRRQAVTEKMKLWLGIDPDFMEAALQARMKLAVAGKGKRFLRRTDGFRINGTHGSGRASRDNIPTIIELKDERDSLGSDLDDVIVDGAPRGTGDVSEADYPMSPSNLDLVVSMGQRASQVNCPH